MSDAAVTEMLLSERVKFAEYRVNCEEKMGSLHSQLGALQRELRAANKQLRAAPPKAGVGDDDRRAAERIKALEHEAGNASVLKQQCKDHLRSKQRAEEALRECTFLRNQTESRLSEAQEALRQEREAHQKLLAESAATNEARDCGEEVALLESRLRTIEATNAELEKQFSAVQSAKEILRSRLRDSDESVLRERESKEEALMQLSMLRSEVKRLQEDHDADMRALRAQNAEVVVVQRDEDDVAYLRSTIANHESQINQIFDNMQVIEKAACELHVVVDLLDGDLDARALREHIQSTKAACGRLMGVLDMMNVLGVNDDENERARQSSC